MRHGRHEARREAAYEAAREYRTWPELLQRVTLPPGMTMRTPVRDPAAEGWRLRITWPVPDRDDPGETVTLVATGALSEVPPEDPGEALGQVRRIVEAALIHEMDEQMQLCGVRVFDPHERGDV